MKIVEWDRWNSDDLALQWLAGAIGAMATTLPVFVLMPFWFAFTLGYRVERDNGEPAHLECGILMFCAGILVWLAVFGIRAAL